ncbi:MAG: hypothetical protein RL042_74 [Nitrospirota bacterium]|jgi:hypothetical protein
MGGREADKGRTHQPKAEWSSKFPWAVEILEMIDGKIESMHITVKKNSSRERPEFSLGVGQWQFRQNEA